MPPVVRLVDERDADRAAAAEDDCVDWHAVRVLPERVDGGAVDGGAAEARVGVRGELPPPHDALLAQPAGEGRAGRHLVLHPLPEHAAVRRQADVREDGVAQTRLHRHRVRLRAGAGRDAEEARLRVDGAHPAVGAEAHPGDVVADAAHRPAGQRGHHHRHVGLAARTAAGRMGVRGMGRGRGVGEGRASSSPCSFYHTHCSTEVQG